MSLFYKRMNSMACLLFVFINSFFIFRVSFYKRINSMACLISMTYISFVKNKDIFYFFHSKQKHSIVNILELNRKCKWVLQKKLSKNGNKNSLGFCSPRLRS